jgi:hypothetical protein
MISTIVTVIILLQKYKQNKIVWIGEEVGFKEK